jgi:hypothetical protein
MNAKWHLSKAREMCRGSALQRPLLFLLLLALPLLQAAAYTEPKVSTYPAQSAGSVNDPQSGSGPFSIGYSLGNSPQLMATGVAEYLPGSCGVVLGGILNFQGNISREAIHRLAHVDTPGHIHWAVRLPDEMGSFPTSMTCRQNMIFSVVNTGPNRGSIGTFDAESLKPVKVVQFSVAPLMNQALVELDYERPLPLAVSILQDGGDKFAMTIVSQDGEITLNKTYSIPAFASRSKDAYGRLSRGRVFRAQDGSGYYLVITDVQRPTGGVTAEKKRLGIIRTGLDGSLKWNRLYSFSLGGGAPLAVKVAIDGAILAAAAYGSKSGESFLVKIAPDGREAWAKIFNVPNTTFNDFHCDATPYRFIEPNLKAVGTDVSHGMPQIILLALDYATGGILYQTRFPATFNGGGAFSDQNDSSLYVSTLGIQLAKGGFKGIASICRFDHQLQLLRAKEIIGAQSSFSVLTCGPRGVNMLSYDFSKPFKGVGSAVNDNLEPIDVTCPWTRGLNLVMEHCSYSSTDVQCKEEPLDVEPGEGTATIGPGSFNLLRLALKLENGAEPAVGAQPVQRDPLPARKYSLSVIQKDPPRPLGEPKPVAYRATSEIVEQSNGAQASGHDATKMKRVIT